MLTYRVYTKSAIQKTAPKAALPSATINVPGVQHLGWLATHKLLIKADPTAWGVLRRIEVSIDDTPADLTASEDYHRWT